MTLLKNKTTKIIVIIIIVSFGLAFGTILSSCTIKHLIILQDIQKFEQSLEPEFCESIVFRIDAFNEECEPEIEIIDCG